MITYQKKRRCIHHLPPLPLSHSFLFLFHCRTLDPSFLFSSPFCQESMTPCRRRSPICLLLLSRTWARRPPGPLAHWFKRCTCVWRRVQWCTVTLRSSAESEAKKTGNFLHFNSFMHSRQSSGQTLEAILCHPGCSNMSLPLVSRPESLSTVQLEYWRFIFYHF